MNAATPAPPTHPAGPLTRAWTSLLLFPVAFAGAFLVGEGLVALMGYPVGAAEGPPWWIGALATLPAIALFWVPAVLSTRYARRASRAGDLRGWVPAVLALACALAFTVLNTVPLGQ